MCRMRMYRCRELKRIGQSKVLRDNIIFCSTRQALLRAGSSERTGDRRRSRMRIKNDVSSRG